MSIYHRGVSRFKARIKIQNTFYLNSFDGCIALELGAGVGLCSIVMSRVAKKVYCTGGISFCNILAVLEVFLGQFYL